MEPLLTVLFVVFIYFLFRESSDSTDNSLYKQPRLTDEEHKQRKFDRDIQAILNQPASTKRPIGPHSIFSEPTSTVPEDVSDFIFSPVRESNQFMSREAKLAHMRGAFWKDLKQQRLAIANHTCEVEGCTNTTHLNLHHVDYTNLGAESVEDVRIVCNKNNTGCHSKIHSITGYDRVDYHPIEVLSQAK